MPFNGSNVYSPPAADFPAVTNTLISSTHFNNVINDIATALSDCVTRDGQGALTANLNMGGFKVTNVAAGSAGAPGLYFSSDTSSGLYRSAADEVAITISGTQRGKFSSTGLTITGAASVTTTFTAPTSVIAPILDSGAASAISLKTNNGTTQVNFLHTAAAVNVWNFTGGATGSAVTAKATGSDSNVSVLIATQGSGIVQINTDQGGTPSAQLQVLHTAGASRNITITGSNGGNPTISTSAGALALGCGQLQFPATQNPSADANTLDDYEEGTWTPSLGGTTTYTVQTGKYVKIGSMVFVEGQITVNAIGTGSTTDISGLPFAASPITQILTVRVVAASATNIVSASATTATSSIQIASRTAASAGDAVNAIFQNSTNVIITGCYVA